MLDTVLSIVMLAAVALVIGAVWLFRKGGHRKQAVLMLVLAVVMGVNLVIWLAPASDGAAPASKIRNRAPD